MLFFSKPVLKHASPTRLLTGLYLSTVVVVSLLIVGGQVVTQRSLQRQAQDAKVINVAGRQRMLSQKIAKAANAYQMVPVGSREPAGSVVNTAAARAELRSAIALFESAHQDLQSGNDSMALASNNSEQVLEMFAQIEPHYGALTAAARGLLSPFQSDAGANIATIQAHEGDFLEQMNAIVGQYELEATTRVARLQKTQQLLLLLLLLALLPVIYPIYRVSERVNAMIETMQQSGIQIKTSSFQLVASGKELEATVAEQVATSSQITASSREIATTAKTLTDCVEQVASQAHYATETAMAGAQELTVMAQTMADLETMTQGITQRLGTISDRASTIDRVVEAITKVADQTNLLSLNAAIEAEKAGEYGAGFSVVAREIRRLSDQTELSTLEIESLVKEMQSAVSMGVMEMDKFAKQVADGNGRTAKVTEQVITIADHVQSLVPSLDQVNEGMGLQTLSAGQIRDALEEFSRGSEQTVRSLQESNSALALLQETAEGLRV
ncbi:MAG: methyl-accepting chemotaxis protein [Cyanobacteria bacterium J06598_1]